MPTKIIPENVPEFTAEYLRLVKADLADSQNRLDKLPKEERRGLTLETLRYFHCGFLPDWVNTKSRAELACGLYVNEYGKQKPLPPPSPRIIIPTLSGEHFNAVATSTSRPSMPNRYWKQHVGSMELFCDPENLNAADTIIIVEGEIDAMSIWQASQGKIAAVAILGCKNWTKTLLPKLKDLRGKRFILLLDADAAGCESAKDLSNELLQRKFHVISKKLYDALSPEEQNSFGKKVDANEILRDKSCDGGSYLHNLLNKIIRDAKNDFTELEEEIARQSKNPFGDGTEPDIPVTPTKKPARQSSEISEADGDTIRDEIRLILRDYLPAKILPTRDEWFKVGCIMKRYGFEFADFDAWSRDDSRYNASDCKTQWNSFKTADELGDSGYKIGTLIEFAQKYSGYSTKKKSADRRADSGENNDFDAKINSFEAELKKAEKALADFDEEKNVALELLSKVETFASETVFAPEIVNAAAFAYVFDKQAFSNFRREVKLYGDKHKEEKVSVNDWLASVKYEAGKVKDRRSSLTTRQKQIQAQIGSLKFANENDAIKNFTVPENYEISENGIFKISGDNDVEVCTRPVIINSLNQTVEDETFKYGLTYMTAEGKWHKIPATEAAIVFNSRKLVDLANHGLPVTSQNANLLVEFLDAFRAKNEINFPLTKIVPRCGWYRFNDVDYFVDPRRPCTIQDDGKNVRVVVDDESQFAKSLKKSGNLEQWKKAYALAKNSPVARFMVAAAIAPPLLKILGERNFVLYVRAPTRAGKTTGLVLISSVIGDEKIIRSFDATKNGLAGAAADVNDYPFLIDEKQVADNRLQNLFDDIVYSLANGISRTKLNKNSTLRKMHDWRTVPVMTGETQLLDDNVTGGAFTRSISIKIPEKILSAEDCRIIRDIVKENYGHAFPLVIDKIFELGFEKIKLSFKNAVEIFINANPDVLPEYCRYMAVLTIADALLNFAIGKEPNFDGALFGSYENADEVFPFVPTFAEIDDTARERDFVMGFIAQNQTRFERPHSATEGIQVIYGLLNDNDGFSYVTVKALRDACKIEEFDYQKLVDDLIADGFFVPDDTQEKDRKKSRQSVTKRIGRTVTRCFRIPNIFLNPEW